MSSVPGRLASRLHRDFEENLNARQRAALVAYLSFAVTAPLCGRSRWLSEVDGSRPATWSSKLAARIAAAGIMCNTAGPPG